MMLPSPRFPAMMGMPIAGLLWSLTTLHAKSDLVASLDVGPVGAFLAIAVGGMALTLALWVGFAAVTWAIIRAFGGAISILVLTALISRAAVPLWIGVIAAAYWLNGMFQSNLAPAVIAVTSGIWFLQSVSALLANKLAWSHMRAAACIGTVAVFLACCVYLST